MNRTSAIQPATDQPVPLVTSAPCGPATATGQSRGAFTLIELLVVVGIIALLAALSLPAIKGIRGADSMTAASRQLLDDLALARLKAIAERTTVYVVFVPPEMGDTTLFPTNTYTPAQHKLFNRLLNGQFTDYALYASRSVGDQPGQNRGRYLTDWRSLPDGVFVAQSEFDTTPASMDAPNAVARSFRRRNFPFPTAESPAKVLPFIAFTPQGQLVPFQPPLLNGRTQDDEVIALARGSIFYEQDVDGNYLQQPADVVETPPGNAANNFNRLRINWITGRAKIERPELP
jgi:prepilin-type N-terminal cleavage/methylation domain-containing protein